MMFDEQFKIIKAVQSADASVSMEGSKNDSRELTIINEALKRSANNGSFFMELVKIYNQQKLKEKEEIKYGSK